MNTAVMLRARRRARFTTCLSALAGTTMLAIASPAAAQSAPSVPYDTLFEIPGLPERPFVELTDISDDGSVVVGGAAMGVEMRPIAVRWTTQGMQGLGSLGGSFSIARAVSGDGKVIVGDSSTGDERRAFRWTESGGMQSLGNLGFASYASAVSGDGSVIAGEIMFENFDYRAFRWTERGGMQDLGTLGGNASYVADISADGRVIVGGSYLQPDVYETRAFRWTEATGMQSLGSLGRESSAYKVSRDGTVIIGFVNLENGFSVGFRWTETGGMQTIQSLGGDFYQVSDLSDDGKVIVGASVLAGNKFSHAFRWVEGRGSQDLDTLGREWSSATAVSGDGSIVVGRVAASAGLAEFSEESHAFRWTEEDGMQDLGTLGGLRSEASGISRDGTTIYGGSQNAAGEWRAFIYRKRLIDFTNMIASFALTASDVEALGEGQRQNLGWVLDSTCQIAIGNKGCIGGAVQVMRVAADDKAVLMRRHDQGVKANVGVRLSGALTMGAGFGLFQQEDRAFSLKPDTAFHYGAWLDFAPGGEGPLGFKARLAAGGAVQGNAIERGRGLDNVELTPGRADLATLSARGQVQYGIALGKLALIPNAGITWQRSTLGAFTEAEGDFPAQFERTRWQTSFASLGADLSVPLGAGTRAVLGGKADFDLDSDAVTMTGTSTIPGMETVKATSLYTRKDRRGRFELGLEHLSGKLGFSARAGVHTPVIGSKPTLVFGLGFGAGF